LKYIEQIIYSICVSAASVKVPARVWTSGANEGEYCDVEKIYSWCAINGTRVKREAISLPWADANPPEARERCLSVHTKAPAFPIDDAECNVDKLYAVCEVKFCEMHIVHIASAVPLAPLA
jgi:hypothetical protein